MEIEATVPLRLKWSGRTVVLEPGQCVELPPAQAEKLLIKGLGKVKTVPLNHWVEFYSPLFGRCTGLVELVDGDRLIVHQHSTLKGSAWIYAEWVAKQLPRPPGVPERTE